MLGDASDIPASKAGSVAHFATDVFTGNFLRHVAGQPMTDRFDGHANCFVESGDGKALLIDFNYDVEPLPGRYPIPGSARSACSPRPRPTTGEASVPVDLLERPAARPARPAAGAHVHGRQDRPPLGGAAMPTTVLDGRPIHVDPEGFLTRGHLWACRMSADMMHLDQNDLHHEVEGIISAADFIEKTNGAQLLLI